MERKNFLIFTILYFIGSLTRRRHTMTEESKNFLIRYAEEFYMMYKGYYEKYYKQNQEYLRTCGYKSLKERNAIAREKAKATTKLLVTAKVEDFVWEATGETRLNQKEVWEVLTSQYPEMA